MARTGEILIILDLYDVIALHGHANGRAALVNHVVQSKLQTQL